MMLTIKKRNERTNLQATAHTSLSDRRKTRNVRDAENNDWDVEGEVVGEGVGGVGRTEDTEGGGGRDVQELHLTKRACGTRAADLRRDDLAHVAKDQAARTGSGDVRSNRRLERDRRSAHAARWVVADNVAGRGGELVAIGGRGSNDGGSVVVRVGRGDLTNETRNR
jgi:hypothetical protein